MTDQELRKLKRVELLELLLDQAVEMEKLQQELEEAKAALASRKLEQEQAGTMAEAALRLNGVFEAVDRAAADYLQNAKELSEKAQALWEETQKKCREMTGSQPKCKTDQSAEPEPDEMSKYQLDLLAGSYREECRE